MAGWWISGEQFLSPFLFNPIANRYELVRFEDRSQDGLRRELTKKKEQRRATEGQRSAPILYNPLGTGRAETEARGAR